MVSAPAMDRGDDGVSPAHKTLNFVIDAFMCFDVILNFFTGYIDSDEHVTMELRKIAGRYLKSWFVIDLFASLPLGERP